MTNTYYLLTGVIPFGASYINAKIHPNLELPEIPPVTSQRNLPIGINQVLKKALNKDPVLRQQSAKQLFEEFKDALQLSTTSDERVITKEFKAPAHRKARSKSPINTLGLIIGLLIILTVFGGIIYIFEGQKQPSAVPSPKPQQYPISLSPSMSKSDGEMPKLTIPSAGLPVEITLMQVQDMYSRYTVEILSGNETAPLRVGELHNFGGEIKLPPMLLTDGDFQINLYGDNPNHDARLVGTYYFRITVDRVTL